MKSVQELVTGKRWTDSRSCRSSAERLVLGGPYDGRTNSVRWVMGRGPHSGPRRTSPPGGQLINNVRLNFCVAAELAAATSDSRFSSGRIRKDDQGEYLKIGFSPTSIPIQQRWRNNGLSANFLADYLSR
jgi:hypothetical protein